MEEIDDVPFGIRTGPLPPIGGTPRDVRVELSQPQSLNSPRTPRTPRVGPSPRWATESAEDKPRKSVKQVSVGHREWTHGTCSCCEDKKQCVLTCVCPCAAMWVVSERLDESCVSAWMPCTCIAMRTKVRAVGGIKGSVLRDCCMVTCCPWLSICQLVKEIDHMVLQPEVYVKPVNY